MEQMKRAVRPYYIAVEQVLNDTASREALIERDRALALEAVLTHAPDLGMEDALKKYGESLLPTEHKLLLTLTKEELTALKSIRAKVGNLFAGKAVTINIYKK